MPKSRAEIQREYRQRKKEKDGETYRRNELLRVMKYYDTAENLPEKKLKKRNYENMLRNRASRARKTAIWMAEAEADAATETSGYESGVNVSDVPAAPESSAGARVIVKLAFVQNKRANGPKVAKKRALARALKAVRGLQNSVEKLQKRIKVKKFDWASGTDTVIKYIFVNKTASEARRSEIASNKSMKPVSGTMELHAIEFDCISGSIMKRDTSCYCPSCITSFCDGWTAADVEKSAQKSKVHKDKTVSNESKDSDGGSVDPIPKTRTSWNLHDWVMFLYEGEVFPGKIEEVTENGATIKAMAKCKKLDGSGRKKMMWNFTRWKTSSRQLKSLLKSIIGECSE